MSRTTFYRTKDYTLSFENINGYLFVHIGVRNFSKAILTSMKKAWWEFSRYAYFEGYEEIFAYTCDPRIAKMVGGAVEIGQDDPDLVNTGLRMFKWELIQ